MEIELRDLRYFLAVAQQESITKAAEYLFIAQPSLSRRMQKLESELNRLLFVRGSRLSRRRASCSKNGRRKCSSFTKKRRRSCLRTARA